MAMEKVTLKEIEEIFGVIERFGISREAVVIPLRPKHPGGLRRLSNGKIEIVVDAEASFDDWLLDLEEMIRKELGR